ncbi:hypothetical protein BDF20DRAFT_943704 [Mycotypha africana]|uniref:uncharacterized protein n=1 Tax=Mycotypha africana TaxID=64632 RepID=UPI002301E1BE|nr:uncharacterized protein BDF20DRAFT_943704 [Mycotypha africana]KAI8975247.1 hypothetical protein BDF20DRAFT_943704 [Mycotypha africana]
MSNILINQQRPKRNKRQDSVKQVDWIDTDASEDEDFLPQFPYQPPFPAALSIKDYFLKRPYSISGSSISESDSSSLGDEEEVVDEENTYNDNFRLADGYNDDTLVLEEEEYLIATSNSSQKEQRNRARSSSHIGIGRRNTDSNDNDIAPGSVRINSSSWDINTRETFRRKLGISNDTPFDKVRRAIDATIDNGVELVDMSNLGLTEIPDEVKELEYVTVVQNDKVRPASLQIYLYSNELSRINPTLFKLKNITVLSLRNNKLDYLPSDIALLENLVELSLGNNQLKYLPSEVLHLKKLAILLLSPNPFLPVPEPSEDQPSITSTTMIRRSRIKASFATLFETSTRVLLNEINTNNALFATSSPFAQIIPNDILNRIQSVLATTNHACEHCKKSFLKSDIEEMVWQSILGNSFIPVLYRFCSLNCCQQYPFPTNPPVNPDAVNDV